MNKTTHTQARPTGQALNARILNYGVVALVDLGGDRVWFFPPKLPLRMVAELEDEGGRRLRLLRDFLVTLGRDIV